MQRRSAQWLLRPFPLGLRFSGKNMSPLPGWLAGAQNVCLNFSDNDLAVQLHFALFDGSGGYVLKPPEMRRGALVAAPEGGAGAAGVAAGGALGGGVAVAAVLRRRKRRAGAQSPRAFG